ncbi:MAG: ATP-grasp domain-containing protein [Planctomycetota bacterium]
MGDTVKQLRILMLTQADLVPPERADSDEQINRAPWRTDYDVRNALRELGHDVIVSGSDSSLDQLRAELDEARPDLVFNLLEMFAQRSEFLPHVLSYLELRGQPYTGCNPIGMSFSVRKPLQRKILRHHRIATPEFAVARMNKQFSRPSRLEFPLIVKSISEHGSIGISQASVVANDERLADRIAFIHGNVGTDALVEEFIEGRELYVGILGNTRLTALPIWELGFDNLRDGAPNIATSRLKWDVDEQERVGLTTGPAVNLDDPTRLRISRICKRAFRALEQNGYARFDIRLRPTGQPVIIESNPNPELAWNSEFPSAAKATGLDYPKLLTRILSLGRQWSERFA